MQINRWSKNFFTGETLELYLFFSLVVSFSIWAISYWTIENFLPHSFFESLFVLVNYELWRGYKGFGSLYEDEGQLPAFLSLQIVCLLGIAFHQNLTGAIYLALVPSIFAFYTSRNKQVSAIDNRKAIALVMITFSSYWIFHGWYKQNMLYNAEGSVITVFFIWTMVIFYNPFRGRRRERVNLEQKDRLFFHDMVNHTHGLNLFLSNRANIKTGLSPEECKTLVGEIKTVQSLLKNHFGYWHKDLVNPYEYVTFEYAKEGIINLVYSFLPQYLVESEFIFKGLISEERSIVDKDSCVINYPLFSRVLTNLVKNISESKSREVILIFDYHDDGLHMTIKNRVFNLSNESATLSKQLNQIIMASPRSERERKFRGVGLESISTICQDIGGWFNFEIEDGYWVSEVFFPRNVASKQAA